MKSVSLSHRLTLAMVFAVTLVIVLVAGGFYFYTANKSQQTFEQNIDQKISYLEGALGPLLWNISTETVVHVLEIVVQDDLIVGIILKDDQGKVLYSKQQENKGDIIHRRQIISFNDVRVGDLEIQFSSSHLNEYLTSIIWVSLTVWVLAVVSISLLLSVFIRIYFRGPLATFTRLARSYRQEPALLPIEDTPFVEFQPIENVVRSFANDTARQMQELRDSEANYRALFENALYGIAITGQDFEFVKVNQAWCNLIGYSEAELLDGMRVSDVTMPDIVTESMEILDKLIKAEITEGSLEKRYKTKSGSIIDAITFVRGIYDTDGRYIGNGATILDITERKRAELELEKYRKRLEEMVNERTRELGESEEKYRMLYNQSPSMMVSVDVSDRKIVECNDALLRNLGYSREEVIGIEIFELYHADSLEAAHDVFRHFLKTSQVREAELQLARKDGEKIDVLLDVSVREDKKTGKKYILSVWRDITDRIRIERDLRRTKEDLESANQRLLELDKLKSMFIASMSHELRTPLNSIISFSGILLQNILGEINERQRDSLERVQRSGRHLLSLISDVIDISKIEAGKIDLYAEDVNLAELVDEALDNVRVMARDKGLQLISETTVWPALHTDPRRLLQCLVNLLTNAVKYTLRGQITLVVSSNKDNVYFEVIDTGIGISQQDITKLFVAFSRLDSHLLINPGGTGLGLYLTNKIAVELLEGSIAVESVEGKGSTFTLSIARNLD